MSSATIAVAPAAPSLITTLLPMAAAGTAGFALTSAAVLAAHRLRLEYQEAKCEAVARMAQEEAAWAERFAASIAAEESATSFAAATEAVATSRQSESFVAAAAAKLAARAEFAGDLELAKDAMALSTVYDVNNVDRYFELLDRLEASLRARNSNEDRDGEISEACEQIRAELESPILARREAARMEMVAQLEELEELSGKHHAIAKQALENLRNRTRRELRAAADESAGELERREITADIFAHLRALTKLGPGSPSFGPAERLLSELAALYRTGTPSLKSLKALQAKAKELFDSCEAGLIQEATSAYVAESVADVLVGMGYKVSSIPSEDSELSCQINLDQNRGMIVSVARDGEFRTELVAYSESSDVADKEAEESVCQLVDELFEALKKRDIKVREKARKYAKSGQRLRVVKRLEQEKLVAVAAAAKARHAE